MGPGDYEAEDDEKTGMMHISRVRDDGERELVAAVPAGRYTIEHDDNAAHLFRLAPEGEPDPAEAALSSSRDGLVPTSTVASMVELGRRLWGGQTMTTQARAALRAADRGASGRNR